MTDLVSQWASVSLEQAVRSSEGEYLSEVEKGMDKQGKTLVMKRGGKECRLDRTCVSDRKS